MDGVPYKSVGLSLEDMDDSTRFEHLTVTPVNYLMSLDKEE
jgi:hypothetical protein